MLTEAAGVGAPACGLARAGAGAGGGLGGAGVEAGRGWTPSAGKERGGRLF